MPYLGAPYANDIFLSYSHGAIPGIEEPPLKTWSQFLIDRLRGDLGSANPDFKKLEIWDDRGADRTFSLTDQLKYQVEKSAILLIIMSPPYLASDWCVKDELEWFAAQFADRRKGPGRVFVVRGISTVEEKWPSFLKDARGHPDLGFSFHPETQEEGTFPYGWPKFATEPFYQALAPLRTALMKRLVELREELKRPAPAARADPSAVRAAPPPGMARLYFHAPRIADAMRDAVANDLRAAGCKVIDPRPQPAGVTIADLSRESRERIALATRCDAMTIVRTATDAAFGDDLIAIAFDELERINAARAKDLPCAILDDGGTEDELLAVAQARGIRRFNIDQPNWPRALTGWLQEARL